MITSTGPGPVLTELSPTAQTLAVESGAELWACPVNFATSRDPGDPAEELRQEIRLLEPWHDRQVTKQGYSATGTSHLTVWEVVDLLVEFASGTPPLRSPVEDQSLGDTLKLAAEDLKMFYYESALAQPGYASAERMARWLWRETAAGALILKIRNNCKDHPDELVKLVAAFTLVPQAEKYIA